MKHGARSEWGLALFLLALPAMAGEPAQPASPNGPTTAAAVAATEPASPIPNLPENQAEIEALANGQLVLEPAPAVGTTLANPASLSPEMLEIGRVVNAERARLAELEARLRDTADDTAALSLLREIEQVKQGTEVEILRIQAKFARSAGREAQAQEIEAAVTQILAPAPALAAPPASTVSPSGDARR